MRVTHLELSNWRNFKSADISVGDRLFIFGPNASGKSNLIDALRFLRDLTLDGGGFQQAIRDRGGVARVRNLAARNHNGGRVTIGLTFGDDDEPEAWNYRLTFTRQAGGRARPIVHEEIVHRAGREVLKRPDSDDIADPERLSQTALEQVIANREFREVADFLASTRYLHLVPQVIRDPERGASAEDDPFGGDFLSHVARTPKRERERRLRTINEALRLAVPQLENLELMQDADGLPHLEARYVHWRERGARQDEKDFSDGTLRLIGLLWSLQDRGSGTGRGPILLEEPELSLHSAIVRQLPTIMLRASRRTDRQVIASTHATEILADEGLGLDEVVVLDPSAEGTSAQLASSLPDVVDRVESGLTLEEALAGELTPDGIRQLSLSLR